MMTTLREAAQQALEALERADKISGYANNKKAIAALRAALAEPVQESTCNGMPAIEGPLSRSQRMREAGFTLRDNRLTCDECGGKFTRQMLPIHKCAALAEPNHDYERGFVEGMSEQARRSVDHAVNAMAERKPLTEEEIRDLWVAETKPVRYTSELVTAFARAIERANGIGTSNG